MALGLPAQVDVDLERSRLASVKLTKREELAFTSVQDPELRGLLAQVVRALSGSQQNFERVALQFPLKPSEGGVVLGPEVVGFAQLKAALKEKVEALEALLVLIELSEGQLTVSSDLAHTGGKAGFYGAPPVGRGKVTGSRGSGEALKSLLEKLDVLGIVEDETTE